MEFSFIKDKTESRVIKIFSAFCSFIAPIFFCFLDAWNIYPNKRGAYCIKVEKENPAQQKLFRDFSLWRVLGSGFQVPGSGLWVLSGSCLSGCPVRLSCLGVMLCCPVWVLSLCLSLACLSQSCPTAPNNQKSQNDSSLECKLYFPNTPNLIQTFHCVLRYYYRFCNKDAVDSRHICWYKNRKILIQNHTQLATAIKSLLLLSHNGIR